MTVSNYAGIPRPTLHPEEAIPEVKPGLKTTSTVVGCASVTAASTKILNPKYSFLVIGIKLMCEPVSGDYLRGLPNAIGVLVLMAAPVGELLRVGLGLTGMIGGAAATAVTGTAWGAEWVTRKTIGLVSYSEVESKRETYTKAFIKRINEILNSPELTPAAAQYYNENPRGLIGIAAIAVAFLSRREEGNKLRGREGSIIKQEDIYEIDHECQGYFDDLCIMKNAIRDLALSPSDRLAWNYLMGQMVKINEEDAANTITNYEVEQLNILMNAAENLSTRLYNDEIFQNMWNIQRV